MIGRMKHGNARRGAKTPEYNVWVLIRQRCLNPDDPSYVNYGGRGVRICQRWETFENFLKDMGTRPAPNYTVERKNNDGNYSPRNCVWKPRSEQSRNRRTTFWFEASGERLCLAELARRNSMKPAVLNGRLRRGWSLGEALSTPLLPRGVGHRPSRPDQRPSRPAHRR